MFSRWFLKKKSGRIFPKKNPEEAFFFPEKPGKPEKKGAVPFHPLQPMLGSSSVAWMVCWKFCSFQLPSSVGICHGAMINPKANTWKLCHLSTFQVV